MHQRDCAWLVIVDFELAAQQLARQLFVVVSRLCAHRQQVSSSSRRLTDPEGGLFLTWFESRRATTYTIRRYRWRLVVAISAVLLLSTVHLLAIDIITASARYLVAPAGPEWNSCSWVRFPAGPTRSCSLGLLLLVFVVAACLRRRCSRRHSR